MPTVDAPLALSIVSTLYKSERFVEDFVKRAAAAAVAVTADFEIVLVDDGSPDQSLAVAIGLMDDVPRLRVIELARNFGHHPAILAGLAAARGELVFFVDSDLEEAPELLLTFARNLGDYDVVYGVRDRTDLPLFRRITSSVFWRIISRLANVEIPPGLANARLMRRAYVNALTAMPDRNVFLGGMFAWPGFRQRAVKIERTSRDGSSYSWSDRFKLAARAAIAFSDWPLFAVFWCGLGIAGFSFLVGAIILAQKLLNPSVIVNGFTSIMVSIWFLGGLLLACIGTVGLYAAHIYNQARGRPVYIVRAEHERSQ